MENVTIREAIATNLMLQVVNGALQASEYMTALRDATDAIKHEVPDADLDKFIPENDAAMIATLVCN